MEERPKTERTRKSSAEEFMRRNQGETLSKKDGGKGKTPEKNRGNSSWGAERRSGETYTRKNIQFGHPDGRISVWHIPKERLHHPLKSTVTDGIRYPTLCTT